MVLRSWFQKHGIDGLPMTWSIKSYVNYNVLVHRLIKSDYVTSAQWTVYVSLLGLGFISYQVCTLFLSAQRYRPQSDKQNIQCCPSSTSSKRSKIIDALRGYAIIGTIYGHWTPMSEAGIGAFPLPFCHVLVLPTCILTNMSRSVILFFVIAGYLSCSKKFRSKENGHRNQIDSIRENLIFPGEFLSLWG